MILILGGTAAYFLPLEESLGPLRRVDLDTPYGPAFPIFLLGRRGERVAFASRHGLGRLEVSPPFVNARANIWAAHALGVRRILSWNGVGAINPLLEVHDLLALDRLLDFSKTRVRGFQDVGAGGPGQGATYPPAQPWGREAGFDPRLSRALYEAAVAHNERVFSRGIYACSEGPRLETAAEIRAFRLAGADVVGMTLVPEVFLAQELGVAYASLAYVTNYATGVEPAHGAPRFFGVEVGRRCLQVALAAADRCLEDA